MDIGNKKAYILIAARLEERNIVVNTQINGKWQEENGRNIKVDPFPFEMNVPFELRVAFQSKTYMVTLVCDSCIVNKL